MPELRDAVDLTLMSGSLLIGIDISPETQVQNDGRLIFPAPTEADLMRKTMISGGTAVTDGPGGSGAARPKSSVNASGGEHANNQNHWVRKEVSAHLVGVLKDRIHRNEFHSNELVYKTRKLGAEPCAP